MARQKRDGSPGPIYLDCGHETLAVTSDAGIAGTDPGRDIGRRTEQHLRLAEFGTGAGAHLDHHDGSVGGEVIELLAVLPPEHHACAALL